MSEILRTAIKTFAPPGMLIFVLYRFYQKLAPLPVIQNMVATYRKLWTRIKKSKVRDLDEETIIEI